MRSRAKRSEKGTQEGVVKTKKTKSPSNEQGESPQVRRRGGDGDRLVGEGG